MRSIVGISLIDLTIAKGPRFKIENFLELQNKLKPLCNNFVDFGSYFSENIELN